MKTHTVVTVGLIASVVTMMLTSCTNSTQENSTTESKSVSVNSELFSLIEKKGIISFPEMEAEVNYLSDKTLHWRTIDKDGKIAEGDEKIDYARLTDNLHFLNHYCPVKHGPSHGRSSTDAG